MNMEKNLEMYRNGYKNNAENAIQSIVKLVPFFEEGMRNTGDRNSLDEVLNKINAEAQKGKNPVVMILCSKAYAKISKLNKNYSKSIELYKQCKNYADIPMFF